MPKSIFKILPSVNVMQGVRIGSCFNILLILKMKKIGVFQLFQQIETILDRYEQPIKKNCCNTRIKLKKIQKSSFCFFAVNYTPIGL